MGPNVLKALLEGVRDGTVEVGSALDRLRTLPYDDIGFARLDTHRGLRTGCPEVVYCPGKTPEQVRGIFARAREFDDVLMATRAEPAVYEAVREVRPDAEYHAVARIVSVGRRDGPSPPGAILVVTAGTSDLPVAEEAAVTAELLGHRVERVVDVGVAGLHRLLHRLDQLRGAAVIVVVAGMEGALAGVVAGLVDRPVVGVPTSVGYGAGAGGMAALLGMLSSCSPGLAVVNIDNGFGAGVMATRIHRAAVRPGGM